MGTSFPPWKSAKFHDSCWWQTCSKKEKEKERKIEISFFNVVCILPSTPPSPFTIV